MLRDEEYDETECNVDIYEEIIAEENGDQTDDGSEYGESVFSGSGKTRDEEAEALWDKYFETRDPAIKNQLLTYYLPIVVSVVKRMMPKYRDFCDKDDLISSGMLGLIDAVEKFSLKYRVQFQTYASIRIRGEVLDYLRKQDWASTGLRRKLTAIQKASDDLEKRLNRMPSEAEIAKELGISEREVCDALQRSQMFNAVHFETLIYEKNNEDALKTSAHDPSRIVENQEMNDMLKQVVGGLPEKERMVIVLHYYEGLTMKNIAKSLGVSESRVSQIHSRTLMRMRRSLEKDLTDAGNREDGP